MHTPYFPSLRSRLAALGSRKATALRQSTLEQLQGHFRQLLPAPLLSTQDEGPNSRDRTFNLRLTFECFIWQMLKPRTSCREVVRHVQALLRLNRRKPVAPGDSAYVQARQRLPKERMASALAATAQMAERRITPSPQLQGRPVKVVDGTTVQLADTPRNQKRFPQNKAQKPGCGFPVLKLVVLFSLNSGALLQAVWGSLHNHDLRLVQKLWKELQKGDILLGDRAFGEYTSLAGLFQRGIDVVARLHQRRAVDFRKASRLAKCDALFTWSKSDNQCAVLSKKRWQALPRQLTVRLIRFRATIRGHHSRRITLVTTLLDPKLYPAEQLIALYARRWRLELCLRDLKTMMGMEQLRCKSPAMVEKELLAYLITHNLLRCLMADAVAQFHAELDRLSFKGAVDALRQYSAALDRAPNQKRRRELWHDLLWALCRDLVPLRPGRQEPRALKRRPKQYPLLNRPRHQFREIPHRSRHWNAKPRNYRALN